MHDRELAWQALRGERGVAEGEASSAPNREDAALYKCFLHQSKIP